MYKDFFTQAHLIRMLTDHYVISSIFHIPVMDCCIPVSKCTFIKCKSNCFFLSGLQEDFLKSFQFSHRTNYFCLRGFHVKLNNSLTGAVTGILHLNTYLYRFLISYFFFIKLKITVLKCCVR